MCRRIAGPIAFALLALAGCGSTQTSVDVGQASIEDGAPVTTTQPGPDENETGESIGPIELPTSVVSLPLDFDADERPDGTVDPVVDRIMKFGGENPNDPDGEPLEVLCFTFLDSMGATSQILVKMIIPQDRPEMLDEAIADFPSDLALVKERLNLAILRVESVRDALLAEAVDFADQLVGVYRAQLEALEKNGRDHQDLADSTAAYLELEEAAFESYLTAAEGNCPRPVP